MRDIAFLFIYNIIMYRMIIKANIEKHKNSIFGKQKTAKNIKNTYFYLFSIPSIIQNLHFV